jgi:hypothetical protein
MADPQITLEQIQGYRPPKDLHPIAKKTWDLYAAADHKLTDEALAEIRKELRTHYGNLKNLTDALCGLGAFIMYVMESRQDKVAAEQIGVIIGETGPQFESVAKVVTSAFQDAAKKARGVFDRFRGKEDPTKAKAPKFGEAKPEGAVSLSTIKPQAQPPVHVRLAKDKEAQAANKKKGGAKKR